MMRAQLDDDDVERIAAAVADLVIERLRDPSTPDEWMTTQDASVYLGITTNALHKLTAARQIPFSQENPGGKLFFRREDLDAWRASQAHGPAL
jgi:excisionase family DNA binding protein